MSRSGQGSAATSSSRLAYKVLRHSVGQPVLEMGVEGVRGFNAPISAEDRGISAFQGDPGGVT